MAESNKEKERVCKTCHRVFDTTAIGIKAHASQCEG